MRTGEGTFEEYHIVWRRAAGSPSTGVLIIHNTVTGEPFEDEASAREHADFLTSTWEVDVEVYHVTYMRVK